MAFNAYQRLHPYAATRYAMNDELKKKNAEKRQRDQWLLDNKGCVRDTILVPMSKSIKTVSELDSVFYPIDRVGANNVVQEKAMWLEHINALIEEEAFTWRLLDKIVANTYNSTYVLHFKMGKHFTDLMNTSISGLRTGQHLYALPPILAQVRHSDMHVYSMYNKYFSHCLLVDETDMNMLINDCAQAVRWKHVLEKLNAVAPAINTLSVTTTDYKPEIQMLTAIGVLPPVAGAAPQLTALPVTDTKNRINNDHPGMKSSPVTRWLEKYNLTVNDKADLYYYVSCLKPIGKILANVHPYDLTKGVNAKVNVGAQFRVMLE